MAYTLIATQTLVAPSGTVTFSNIPGTFKDLVLEVVASNSNGAFGVDVRPNGVSSSLSQTLLTGSGTAAASARTTNAGTWYSAYLGGLGSSNGESQFTVNFMSYANTNVNKTALIRFGRAAGEVNASVGLWNSTSAITSILIASGVTLNAGSTFKLWGVS